MGCWTISEHEPEFESVSRAVVVTLALQQGRARDSIRRLCITTLLSSYLLYPRVSRRFSIYFIRIARLVSLYFHVLVAI